MRESGSAHKAANSHSTGRLGGRYSFEWGVPDLQRANCRRLTLSEGFELARDESWDLCTAQPSRSGGGG
jgi:hypothetical protein